MTGTWFLIGTAIGLLTAAIVKGIPIFRRHYTRNLRRYETQIPTWVNQGNRQPVVISLAQLEEEINFALWEQQLEEVDE